jgi:hypothetical protein
MAPAPLAVFVFDYGRMGDLILASETDADADAMRRDYSVRARHGPAARRLARRGGVASWMSIELR